MPQTSVTITPAPSHNDVSGYLATPSPITGEHRITITSDGDEDDTSGHLIWLLAIAAAAAVAGCETNGNERANERRDEERSQRYPG